MRKTNKQTNMYPLYVAIETEDIEDTVGVHLDRVQSVHHDHRRVGVGTIFARRRWRGSVARPVASSSAPSHRRTHPATLVGWGPVALVIAVVTAT